MNSISDYVMENSSSIDSEREVRIRRLFQRADRHQAESERLLRMGDQRQAEMHASIARTHIKSAASLEVADSAH